LPVNSTSPTVASCDVRPFPDSGTEVEIQLKCYKDISDAGYPQYINTWIPSVSPTRGPTVRPTALTGTLKPTLKPSLSPTPIPVPHPTYYPTLVPNVNRTSAPTITTKAPSTWDRYLLDTVLTTVIVSLPHETDDDQENLAYMMEILEGELADTFGTNLTQELERSFPLQNLDLTVIQVWESHPEVVLEYLGKIYITLIIIIVAIGMLGFHGLIILFCTSNFKDLIYKEGKSILFRDCCCSLCQCGLPEKEVEDDMVEGGSKKPKEQLTEAEQREKFLRVVGTCCYVFWTCDTNMAYTTKENDASSGDVQVLDDNYNKVMSF